MCLLIVKFSMNKICFVNKFAFFWNLPNFSPTVRHHLAERKFSIFYLVEKIKKFERRTQNVICENGSLHKDLIRIKITPQDMLIKQQSASRTFGRSSVKKRSTLSAWIATISRACSKKSEENTAILLKDTVMRSQGSISGARWWKKKQFQIFFVPRLNECEVNIKH